MFSKFIYLTQLLLLSLIIISYIYNSDIRQNKLNNRINLNETNIRRAYMISTDKNSNRSLWSHKLLSSIGFNVQVIIPDYNFKLEPAASLVLNVLNIFDICLSSSQDWCYIFEDDIDINKNVTLDELTKWETEASMLFYLGICLDGINKKHQIDTKYGPQVSTCGHCTHAFVINKIGIHDFINKSFTKPKNYIDKMLLNWCKNKQFGFLVPELKSPSKSKISGHVGYFYQNRQIFESGIDNTIHFNENISLYMKKTGRLGNRMFQFASLLELVINQKRELTTMELR